VTLGKVLDFDEDIVNHLKRRMDERGRITLPIDMRSALDWRDDDVIEIVAISETEITLVNKSRLNRRTKTSEERRR